MTTSPARFACGAFLTMAYYLVGQWTDAGLDDLEKRLQRKMEGEYERIGTNWRLQFNRNDHSHPWKVTSRVFKKPGLIRAYFRANRAEFGGGRNPAWDEWLNGEDSKVETLDQLGFCRFYYVKCNHFTSPIEAQFGRMSPAKTKWRTVTSWLKANCTKNSLSSAFRRFTQLTDRTQARR